MFQLIEKMKHKVNCLSMNANQRNTINIISHSFAIEIDFHRFENQELKSIQLFVSMLSTLIYSQFCC